MIDLTGDEHDYAGMLFLGSSRHLLTKMLGYLTSRSKRYTVIETEPNVLEFFTDSEGEY